MDFDEILPCICGDGRYQIFLYYVISIPINLICAFTLSSFIYVSATPKHWCRVPELDSTNMSVEEKLHFSIPFELEDGILVPSSCEMYDVNYSLIIANMNGTIMMADPNWPRSGCKYGWDYDRSTYYRTLVTEMDIICDLKHLPVIANSGFCVGNMVGPLIFGHFSDKYGRKCCTLMMAAISVTVGIMACFPPNYIAYIVYRSFMGLTSISIYTVPLVLTLELILPEKRELYGLFYSILFSTGLVAFSGISYALRDWFYISLVSSFPFVLLLLYWWVMPESPRWLLSQDRIEDAEAVVQKIAKANGVEIKENFLALKFQEYAAKHPRKMSEAVIKSPHIELLIHPNMRMRLMILTFDMIVSSVMYNSLLFGVNLMQLNDYLSSAVLSFSEIPGVVFAWIITFKWGRKWAMFLSMGIGGVACFCIIFVPLDYVVTIFILSNIGKAGVSGAYAMIFLFGSELFPTPLRSTALLIACLFASLVTIGVPYFLLLGELNRTLPFIIMGALSIAGSLAVIYLPETKNIHLPQTILEGEALGRENKCCHFGLCEKINTIVQST